MGCMPVKDIVHRCEDSQKKLSVYTRQMKLIIERNC